MAKIITFGASIDYSQGWFLTNLLRVDPEAGMAMYEALTGAEARRAALHAAAETKLSAEDHKLFLAVTIATEHARRIRNIFAHHIYAHSKELKDTLLLIDPQAMVELDVGIQATNNRMNKTRRVEKPPTLDKTRVAVYRLKDLEEAADVCHDAYDIWNELALGTHFSSDGSLSKTTRKRLLAEPLVAQALGGRKLRNSRKRQLQRQR